MFTRFTAFWISNACLHQWSCAKHPLNLFSRHCNGRCFLPKIPNCVCVCIFTNIFIKFGFVTHLFWPYNLSLWFHLFPIFCLKCCESLVKLSDVGEFCSPKLCLDDQQTGAEAQLPPLHKSSPNLFFDQLPSQQDQAACKQWKYWRILGKKNFFTLASVLWMATLSYRHFLTISCWPLDSSCSNKLGKVEFIDQFEFWTTRFFDILQNWWVSAPQKEFLASLILMTFPLKIDDPYFVRGSSKFVINPLSL